MILSPGDLHKSIPRGLKENVRFRLDLLEKAHGNLQVQSDLRQCCRDDILFFINAFVWQYNPKKKGCEVGPFMTWDFQETALLDRPETWDGNPQRPQKGILWYYENDRTCVVEKSREMGASWLFLIFQAWLGMFFDRTQSLNISKDIPAVDSKSPDSLFWKIRFMHEHFPPWLRGGVIEQKMYIEYERTKSVATGTASTERAGVGGRAGVIFVDEFSEIKEDKQVRSKTASTSDCRFFNGTHKGVETEFYHLTLQADQGTSIGKIVMHWSQHPEKKPGWYQVQGGVVVARDPQYAYPKDFKFNVSGKPTGGPFPGLRSPWYDWKCGDIGDEHDVAMQLDINPEGAMSQFFNPLVIQKLRDKYCCDPIWEGVVEYDERNGMGAKLKAQKGGRAKLWINPNHEGKLPMGRYTAGSDHAWGAGVTPSVLTVFDVGLEKKVLEYADPEMEPTPFSRLVWALLSLFEDEDGTHPRYCWETNGPGAPFTKQFLELGYDNYYMRTDELPLSLVPKVTAVPGWTATVANKKVLLDDYRTALAEEKFINHSWPALKECLAFRHGPAGDIIHAGQETTDPQAARANHGDRVIADGLAWKMARAMGLWTPKQKKPEPTLASIAGRRAWAMMQERQRSAYTG